MTDQPQTIQEMVKTEIRNISLKYEQFGGSRPNEQEESLIKQSMLSLVEKVLEKVVPKKDNSHTINFSTGLKIIPDNVRGYNRAIDDIQSQIKKLT